MPDHLSTQLSHTPSLQNTQNNMWPFSTNDEPVDAKLAEPKRFSRKELEEQVASLTERIKGAYEEVRRYDDAQRKTATFNAELNEKVSTLKTQCDRLHAKLQGKQAILDKNAEELDELEHRNEKLDKSLKARAEAEYKAFQGLKEKLTATETKLNDANKTIAEQRENVATLSLDLEQSQKTAREVLEVYKANKSLEEENKRIKLENERIVSQMEQLKQATEEKIAKCKAEATLQKMTFEHIIMNQQNMKNTVTKTVISATKAFVMQKKRKLGNTVGEQSSAGASLPIADVVPCECDN